MGRSQSDPTDSVRAVSSIQHVSATVEPDYFQFYLQRSGAPCRSDQVTDEGYEARLWTADGFVFVGCQRKFGTTPVDIDVLDRRPGEPDQAWQHVAEVSLPEGGEVLEVLDWHPGADPAATVRVGPGPLRLRVHWRGLVEGRFEGMDNEARADERCLIQLWTAEETDPTIVRGWSGWPPGWFDRTRSG